MAALALAWLTGCVALSPDERSASLQAWAITQGWQPRLLPGPAFDLLAFVPARTIRSHRLTVYIEGDGLAWLDRHTPSFAPTPVDPVALRMAMADEGGAAVYLARPCQYVQGPAFKGCHQRYWGSHRMALEVVAAMDRAVGLLAADAGASELVLVGYSGGAGIAALLAARRNDVVALVTVAGVLDIETWAQQLRVSPLEGSLNPRDVSVRLAYLRQWHFIGLEDRVVPPAVLQRFVGAGAPFAHPPVVQRVPAFDHQCCWAKAWPVLSRRFAAPSGPD